MTTPCKLAAVLAQTNPVSSLIVPFSLMKLLFLVGLMEESEHIELIIVNYFGKLIMLIKTVLLLSV